MTENCRWRVSRGPQRGIYVCNSTEIAYATYETDFESPWIYARGVAGSDRHHWRAGGAPVARGATSPRGGAATPVQQLSRADHHCGEPLRDGPRVLSRRYHRRQRPDLECPP